MYYDENFYADLQREEEEQAINEVKIEDEDARGEELDDQKKEREDYEVEAYYYPAEGNLNNL